MQGDVEAGYPEYDNYEAALRWGFVRKVGKADKRGRHIPRCLWQGCARSTVPCTANRARADCRAVGGRPLRRHSVWAGARQ